MPAPLVRPAAGRSRTLLCLLSSAALVATIAGCSTPGGSTVEPDGGLPSDRLEQTSLQVGVLPIVDVAAVQRAQSAGYFAAEGLQVKLVPIQGGAVAIPRLLSGELDMTFSNWPSLLLAQTQGVGDFRLVNAGYDADANTFLVVTRPDSAVRTPQDLVGKVVAVNTFKNIAELVARSAMQSNGIDSNTVGFVEVPFPDMIPALQSGQIDAAVMVEPFITQAATLLGAVSVLDAASGPTEDMPIGGVATTAAFARQNPNTVRSFQRALDKAQAEMSDRSIVEQTLPIYSSITADTAPLLNLGSWPTSLEANRLQRVADLMRQFGVLTAPFDVSPLILPSG